MGREADPGALSKAHRIHGNWWGPAALAGADPTQRARGAVSLA